QDVDAGGVHSHRVGVVLVLRTAEVGCPEHLGAVAGELRHHRVRLATPDRLVAAGEPGGGEGVHRVGGDDVQVLGGVDRHVPGRGVVAVAEVAAPGHGAAVPGEAAGQAILG